MPKRPPIQNLDRLPFPDFSDFSWNKYPHPTEIPIMASRGCVYHCVYCYECVFWDKFRCRSAENIVEEMAYRISQHSFQSDSSQNTLFKNRQMHSRPLKFIFADSLVNGNYRVLGEMCDKIIEQRLNIQWVGQATIDKRMDKSFFQKLKQAGCVHLGFGLESGSQKILDIMNKKFQIKDAGPVLRAARISGVKVTLNVMVGFPSETFLDFIHTIIFLLKNRMWIRSVSNVTSTQLALGTPIWLNPEKFGVTILPDGSWYSHDTGNETDRKRRLRFLHWAMTCLIIPHQKIAKD